MMIVLTTLQRDGVSFINQIRTILAMANKSLIGEFWSYFKERKVWWMVPIIILILLVGILIILAQSSSISPFIYALF